MRFVVFADSGCNLPQRKLQELGIEVVPFSYELDGELIVCPEYPDGFDGQSYYNRLRQGAQVKTSLINAEAFYQAFRPVVEAGKDVLYVGISSGISGTVAAANMAAQQLMEEYPQRKIIVVDSLCASMGQGFLVHQAVKLRDAGETLEDTARKVTDLRLNVVHNFTVDDLGHLHRGGRVSKATAVVGSLMGIKPILHVDDEGHLTSVGKVRGRKASIQALADRMEQQMKGFDNPEVFISHGDCPEDAQALADMVRTRFGIDTIMIGYIGPVIGTHSGPGTLALFFFGSPR